MTTKQLKVLQQRVWKIWDAVGGSKCTDAELKGINDAVVTVCTEISELLNARELKVAEALDAGAVLFRTFLPCGDGEVLEVVRTPNRVLSMIWREGGGIFHSTARPATIYEKKEPAQTVQRREEVLEATVPGRQVLLARRRRANMPAWYRKEAA